MYRVTCIQFSIAFYYINSQTCDQTNKAYASRPNVSASMDARRKRKTDSCLFNVFRTRTIAFSRTTHRHIQNTKFLRKNSKLHFNLNVNNLKSWKQYTLFHGICMNWWRDVPICDGLCLCALDRTTFFWYTKRLVRFTVHFSSFKSISCEIYHKNVNLLQQTNWQQSRFGMHRIESAQQNENVVYASLWRCRHTNHRRPTYEMDFYLLTTDPVGSFSKHAI